MRCSALECLAIGLFARPGLKDHVTSRHAAHVEPPVVGSRKHEAQVIVVGVCPTHEHLPITRQPVLEQSETAFVWQ